METSLGQSVARLACTRRSTRGTAGIVCVLALLMSSWSLSADDVGSEPLEDQQASLPQSQEVQYVVFGESLNATTIGQLRNAILRLRSAVDFGQQPLLVLQINPGAGDHEAAIELAELLTSADARNIRTIAWAPQTLTGPRALLALACNELVLHPDAEFGDLAPPTPFPEAQRQQIQRLLAKRVNPRVSTGLVAAFLDPQQALLHVEIVREAGPAEVRVVTPDELSLLRESGVAVRDVRTLKPAGQPALFSGAQAEAEGFLVEHTARDAAEVARYYRLDPASLQVRREQARTLRPILIKVDGEIQPLLTAYLERQIKRAVEQRADTVIFEIDSPGGLLQDSLKLAFSIADLEQHGMRTVAYVPHDAVSGAALISLGCDEIYLHPNGKIGDAGPIVQTLDGEVHRAPEKIVSYLREYARELAERKRRPPAVLMAMVDRDLTVFQVTHRESGRVTYMSQGEIDAARGEWVRGAIVPESDKELLLFVNGRRAHELQVAEPPVENFEELRERLGIVDGTPLIAAEQTWLDDSVFILNTNLVTGLLFFLGIILLFIELHFMVGIFGIGAALCFGIFFWSKFLGGTADWLEVLLFLLGFACIAMEIFVIPGFGVFGVAGGLLVLGSLLMASMTLNDLDSGASTEQTISAATSLGLAIVGVIVAGAILSHFLPRIPILNAIILTPPNLGMPPSAAGSTVSGRTPAAPGLAGLRGVAVTMLRPAGKVRVDGRLLDAVSSSGFVEAGSEIEVVASAPGRTVVRPIAIRGEGRTSHREA